MKWLAFDIGGANLKASDGDRFVTSRSFRLWEHPERLAGELRTMLAESPRSDHLAITMTGELADCFATRTDGVRAILDAVDQAADHRHTRVHLVDGRLVAPAAARRAPLLAAASNWHALATFAARFASDGPALVIDVGSTTTDIIPLRDGAIATESRSDTDRLLRGELVYTGVERTPVCALIATAPYRGKTCPIMREFFASTQDVYLLTGDLPEDSGSRHTADHRPATRAAARVRIGRMIGSPDGAFHHRDAVLIAQSVVRIQTKRIESGLARVVESMGERPRSIIVAGQGEFLARRVAERNHSDAAIVPLGQKLAPAASRAAPAYALAVLARESVERGAARGPRPASDAAPASDGELG